MIEALLILACLSPNGDSCGKTTQAYGKQSGLEKMLEDFGNDNPEVAFIIGSVGLAKEKRLYYQIYGSFYHNLQVENYDFTQTLWFKKEF